MIGSKRRWREGRPAALVAMQSFTPVFMGSARPWHAGVLYNRDARFADALIAWLNGEEGLIVGDNEPYSVTDKSYYTISVPGERGLLHVEGALAGPCPKRQTCTYFRRVGRHLGCVGLVET
jgi:predicted N-formylglutamate amidohydrolase